MESTQALLVGRTAYIDVWKCGWGTAYVDSMLSDKLELLRAHGVRSCLGGTLLEISWAQGMAHECLDWAASAGFDCVEVSRGVVPLTLADKRDLVLRATERFEVLAEVGSKDPADVRDPDQWACEVEEDIAAGARWVIVEGRESGTAGVYRDDGSVREDIVAAVVRVAGVDRLLFEAPRKEQQAWLIRAFGPEVNLGNIRGEEVLALETLRRGLRADTCQVTRQRQPA